MTIWRMRVACWIPKATNTHSGCVILIAFPLQRWLHERASVLRYMYIACLVLLVVEIRLKILFVWLVLVFVGVVCPTSNGTDTDTAIR